MNMQLNESPIVVRPYTPDDHLAVKEILEEGNLYYEGMDSAERLAGKIRKDVESILVAVTDEKVVGNVFTVDDGGWGAFIFRLAVRKEYRKRGIGALLMDEAEKRLHAKGFREIHILVSEDDQELQAYYEKLKFEKGHTYRWMYKTLLKSD
jgi:ribosomal protein S18 acetylase RimI-like enzyme